MPPKPGPHTARVTVRGVSLSVDTQGSSPTIVFVHGFPLDRSMWRALLPELPSWRRIAPDLPGMGSSAAPPGDWRMCDYADALAALLDALAVPQAVFCGLSMGGYVAFELVRRHAERLEALVLASTRAAADSPQARGARDDAIQLVAENGPAALVEPMLPRLLAPRSLSGSPHVVDHVRAMIAGNRREGVVAALRAMRERADATDLLATIAVPVLVVAGADDQIVPPAEARSMAQAISGARVTIVPEAGHLAPLEQPALVGRAIRGFLEGLG